MGYLARATYGGHTCTSCSKSPPEQWSMTRYALEASYGWVNTRPQNESAHIEAPAVKIGCCLSGKVYSTVQCALIRAIRHSEDGRSHCRAVCISGSCCDFHAQAHAGPPTSKSPRKLTTPWHSCTSAMQSASRLSLPAVRCRLWPGRLFESTCNRNCAKRRSGTKGSILDTASMVAHARSNCMQRALW